MTQGTQAMTERAAAASRPGPAAPRLTLAEETALAHARAERQLYGRWAKKDLEFAVAGSEHIGDETRVRITYRPAGVFRGRPGEEVITIDKVGAVAGRETLHPPREAFPWVLASLAALSVIAAAVLIPLIVFEPLQTGDPLYVPGRILWMRVTEPNIVPEVQFQNLDINGNLSNFRIAPSAPGLRLAVMTVTLINKQSHDVVVVVDADAAEALTRDGKTLDPINTVERSGGIERVDGRYVYAGFVPLWDTVSLGSDQQVQGMLVFEVAPGTNFKEFRWNATDSMIVRFPD
ncbi:MAG: hypothetical protein HY678_01345 [Chloroflexi bacterium]|nr:hypothetical protein [Chloroflexota bacterium]